MDGTRKNPLPWLALAVLLPAGGLLARLEELAPGAFPKGGGASPEEKGGR